jgi:pimeloyl-ACP methyl ester carboxylesterase
LVGHALGAAAARDVALNFPNRVTRLILSGTGAPGGANAAATAQPAAAQTAGETLASWGVIDPTPAPQRSPDRLDALSVPTLVLWGGEDAGLNRASQDRLSSLLRRASQTHAGMYSYWKQYGVRPPPPSRDKHDADDIGHNLSWEAPRQLATDIDSFVRTVSPTRDLYRTDAPVDVHKILVEPGEAVIISSRP